MISPASNFRIYLASQPVDFRKGLDGLAACVANTFQLDPYSGAIYVFRLGRCIFQKKPLAVCSETPIPSNVAIRPFDRAAQWKL